MALNSLWGKLCESSHSKTIFYDQDDVDKFFADYHNPGFNVTSIRAHSDNLISMVYEEEEELMEKQKATSPVIASFVTSGGRVTLYDVLHKLGDKALYWDTVLHFFDIIILGKMRVIDWFP